jgi:hypothetical protein
LTGWNLNHIRGQMNLPASPGAPAAASPWWERLWNQ